MVSKQPNSSTDHQRLVTMRSREIFILVLLHTACKSSISATDTTTSGTAANSPATDTATSGTAANSPTTGGTGGSTANTAIDATTSLANGTVASDGDDLPVEPVACDPHGEMPCPAGQKCSAAAAAESGLVYTGTPSCFPIHGDKQKGEACDLGLEHVDGLDDCGAGTICVDIYWRGGDIGVCVDFCDPPLVDGSVQNCDSPTDFCFNAGCADCSLSMCFPACDPLAPDCPDGTGCEIWPPAFRCRAPNQPLPDVGQSCDEGHACVPGADCVPSQQIATPCGGAVCCTPLCDINAPNTCPGAALGEICQPFYSAPFDPVGEPWGVQYNKLGFCVLP